VTVLTRHLRALADDLDDLVGKAAPQVIPSPASVSLALSPGTLTKWTWREVETRKGESWRWPRTGGGGFNEPYHPFIVYEGTSAEGLVRMGLGWCDRAEVWGKDRRYIIAFHVRNGSKQPVVEFLETDDAESTNEFIAVIRGKGSTKREMYGPGDVLPPEYGHLRIEDYRSRVAGGWRRSGVVAREDDVDTMLDHALNQARVRYGVTPAKGGDNA